jgi:hypothetical protein
VEVGDQIRQSLGPQADVDTVCPDINPLHEQLDDACLLGGEEFTLN